MTITKERLKKLFSYRDGELIRKENTHQNSTVNIGDIAGWVNDKGYRKTEINRKVYSIHRLIFLYHKGYLPEIVDHKNRNVSDNRIENLRACNKSQNTRNAKVSKNNKLGIKGVYCCERTNKYIAYVKTNKVRWQQTFKTLKEAIIMVKQKREELHGKFTCHGGVSLL